MSGDLPYFWTSRDNCFAAHTVRAEGAYADHTCHMVQVIACFARRHGLSIPTCAVAPARGRWRCACLKVIRLNPEFASRLWQGRVKGREGFDGARLRGVRREDELDALGADGAVDLGRVLALRDQLLERAVGRPRRLLHLPTLHRRCQLSGDVNKQVLDRLFSTGALLRETSFLYERLVDRVDRSTCPRSTGAVSCLDVNKHVVFSTEALLCETSFVDEELVDRVNCFTRSRCNPHLLPTEPSCKYSTTSARCCRARRVCGRALSQRNRQLHLPSPHQQLHLPSPHRPNRYRHFANAGVRQWSCKMAQQEVALVASLQLQSTGHA